MDQQKKRIRRRRRMLLCAGLLLVTGTVVGAAALHICRPSPPQEQTPAVQADAPAVLPDDPGGSAAVTARTDFSDVALVGNSQIDAFRIYDPLPGAAYLYRVGLTVDTVFEKPMVGGETPVIDLLRDKEYGYVFLLFGENELGWVYPSVFIDKYRSVIDAVRERQPAAEIYVQSILPVSAEVSQKNEDNTNNARIAEYNALLRQLADEEQVHYLDVAALVQDASGCLPAEASKDGVHLGSVYTQKWGDLIARQIEEDANDAT